MIVLRCKILLISFLWSFSALANDSTWKSLYDSAYNSLNDTDHAIELMEQAEQHALANKSKEQLAKTYYMMGYLYQLQNDIANTKRFYHGALTIYRLLDNHKKQIELMENIGTMSYNYSLFKSADIWFQERLELALEHDHDIIDAYRDLGLVNLKLHAYDNAIKYHLRSWRYYIKENKRDYILLSDIFNNIGMTWKQYAIEYNKPALLDSARKYFTYSIQTAETNVTRFYPTNNIGGIYMHSAQYDSALLQYNLALELGKSVSIRLLAPVYNNIGKIHFNKGEYFKSEEYFRKSIDFNLQKHDMNDVLRDMSLNLDFNNLEQLLVSLNYLNQLSEILNRDIDYQNFSSKIQIAEINRLLLQQQDLQYLAQEDILRVEAEEKQKTQLARLKYYGSMFACIIILIVLVIIGFRFVRAKLALRHVEESGNKIQNKLDDLTDRYKIP